MASVRARRKSAAPTGPPTIDDIKDALNETLDERLDPITEMVAEHDNKLNDHESRIAALEEKFGLHDNLIKMVTGDSLGGAPVRILASLAAFIVGLLVSTALDANGWKPAWWGVAWALIAFAVVGLTQLYLGMRQHDDGDTDPEDNPSPDDHDHS